MTYDYEVVCQRQVHEEGMRACAGLHGEADVAAAHARIHALPALPCPQKDARHALQQPDDNGSSKSCLCVIPSAVTRRERGKGQATMELPE